MIGLFADSTMGEDLTFRTSPSVVVGFCSSAERLKRFARWFSFSFASRLLTVDETASPNRSVLFFRAASVSPEPMDTAGVGVEVADPPNRAALAASRSFTSPPATFTIDFAGLTVAASPDSVVRTASDSCDEPFAGVTDERDAADGAIAAAASGAVATDSETAGAGVLDVSSEIESLRSTGAVAAVESMPSTSANLAMRSDFFAEAGRLTPLSFSSFFNSVTWLSMDQRGTGTWTWWAELIAHRHTLRPFKLAGSRDIVSVSSKHGDRGAEQHEERTDICWRLHAIALPAYPGYEIAMMFFLLITK